MSRQPHVLMIVIDSARDDRLCAERSGRSVMPYLRSLCNSATRYSNANAPGGSTRISMSAIFTGRYPRAYGFDHGRFPDESFILLGQRLQAVGYQTYLFSNNPYVGPATGLSSGFGHVCYLNRSNVLKRVRPATLARHASALLQAATRKWMVLKVPTDLMVTEALAVLRRGRRADKPLFVYLHLDAHHPYLSDRRYLRPFLEPGINESDVRAVERLQRKYRDMLYFLRPEIPARERQTYVSVLQSMYDASLRKADDQVRRIMDALGDWGMVEDCLMIVTSDHGELVAERGMMRHGQFPYEEAMRVPLVVRFPRGIRSPGTCDRLTSTIDLYPTLCDLAGAESSGDGVQGISLLDARGHNVVMNERRSSTEGLARFQGCHPTVDLSVYELGYVIAAKDKRFKYVWTSAGAEYLFDLTADPGETRNLLDVCSDVASRFRETLAQWRGDGGVKGKSDELLCEDAVLDHLRELGYVE